VALERLRLDSGDWADAPESASCGGIPMTLYAALTALRDGDDR
jgi:hypothetical protein